ncbi:MAG: hypothetical protein JST04_16700 [Bdellovibrionales bacterium]|nr:hypothetical protein [Bdellovibrionales bacterium]
MSARPSTSVAAASVLGLAAAFAVTASISATPPDCGKPWVFFDLGNTVVASAPGRESRYVPGAHAYVQELRRRGYPVGLLTNIPEKWGRTRAEKIRALKRLMRETWTTDPAAEAMDWSDFPEAVIVIPPSDAERKPAPYLFEAALTFAARDAGRDGCPVIFQGEDPAEIAAAEKAGLTTYLVGKDPAAPFMPIDRIARRNP